MIGTISYFTYLFLTSFSIIDLTWFGFYYGALGFLLFLRDKQREAIKHAADIESKLDQVPFELIKEFKDDWHSLIRHAAQAFFACGSILGICMSILLSKDTVDSSGISIPAWQDWDRLQNAVRMAGLFILVSLNYIIFLIVPNLEMVGLYQKLFIRKEIGKIDIE